MAVIDDLKTLAAEDVVYLSKTFQWNMMMQPAVSEIFRGRLRQALSGDWVFNASTGQNGVVGFLLGMVDGSWTSNEAPATGMQITIVHTLVQVAVPPMPPQPFTEVVTLTSVIPQDFAD